MVSVKTIGRKIDFVGNLFRFRTSIQNKKSLKIRKNLAYGKYKLNGRERDHPPAYQADQVDLADQK